MKGELDFKRVVLIPTSGKHEYRDTHFVAQCKAVSGWDCYNRIVEYLKIGLTIEVSSLLLKVRILNLNI